MAAFARRKHALALVSGALLIGGGLCVWFALPASQRLDWLLRPGIAAPASRAGNADLATAALAEVCTTPAQLPRRERVVATPRRDPFARAGKTPT